ncbi:MAG: DUF5685 family protein [Clostridiales bacterium]|nr:DUF5685 family protein [Clostridiales bacterium]
MMLIKDYETYKSVYCSLCGALHKQYGIFAKNILSYDITFFCIMAAGLNGAKPCVKKGRCMFNPFKKCFYCTKQDKYLEMGAAFSVISFYYKLTDNIKDDGVFSKLGCYMLLPFAKRYRKKALKKYPHFDIILGDILALQAECEDKEFVSLDRCAHPSAVMLKRLMMTLAENEQNKCEYGEFGYYLGRWVYLIDAIDDIKKDLKKNRFNPFIKMFDITRDNISDDVKQQCNEIVNMTSARLVSAYKKLEIKTYKEICDNIINIGIGQMQKNVIFMNNREEIFDE